jgi:hypothetical protein
VILFSGNWETGDISQWGGAQCANTGVPHDTYAQRGTINIATDVVAQGSYGARFDLPYGETNANGEDKPSACEALRGRTLGLGTDDFYALDVRFPPDWREPSEAFWGLSLAQFDYQGYAGAPVGMFAHAEDVNLGIESGHCAPNRVGTNECQYNTGNDYGEEGSLHKTLHIIPRGTHLAGMWEQFIVHVHHATDSSGVVEGWWRPRGTSTWTRTVDLTGYPTVQWGAVGPPPPSNGTIDKIGAYRGPSTFPISIWEDGFCDATSFAAAASCL